MIRDSIGLIHTVASFGAVALGAIVFLRPKRGPLHRRLGYGYVVGMAVVVVTALMMYRLTGRFNFLHGAALASAITLSLGLGHAISRRPADTWYVWHFHWMSWSYGGLIAALVAELSSRALLPLVVAKLGRGSLFGFWCVVGCATFLVIAATMWLIARNRPAVAARTLAPAA